MKREYAVNSMSCGKCKHHVEECLKETPGIKSFEVLLEEHKIVLEVEDLFSEEVLRENMEEAGYPIG